MTQLVFVTLHNSIVFAICMPKIGKFGENLTKF